MSGSGSGSVNGAGAGSGSMSGSAAACPLSGYFWFPLVPSASLWFSLVFGVCLLPGVCFPSCFWLLASGVWCLVLVVVLVLVAVMGLFLMVWFLD